MTLIYNNKTGEQSNTNDVTPTPTAPVESPAAVEAPAVEATADVPTITRSASGITVLGKKNNLIEAAKEMMLAKQKRNKDLTDREAYWKTVRNDIGAFGSPQPKGSPSIMNDPKDIMLRQLPTDQQQSLRANTRSMADANLSAVQTERDYRTNALGSTINSLTTYLAEMNSADTEKAAADEEWLKTASTYASNGWPIPDEVKNNLYPGLIGGDRYGGTDEWNSQNPMAMAWNPELVRDMGGDSIEVKQGSPKEDGSFLMAFKNEDDGWEAFQRLLTDPKYGYTEMGFSAALNKLSGGKYSVENLGVDGMNPTGETAYKYYSPTTQNRIKDALKSKSDWGVGSQVNWGGGESDDRNYSDAANIAKIEKLYPMYPDMDAQAWMDLDLETKIQMVADAEAELNMHIDNYLNEQKVMLDDTEATDYSDGDTMLAYLVDNSYGFFSPDELKIKIKGKMPAIYFE